MGTEENKPLIKFAIVLAIIGGILLFVSWGFAIILWFIAFIILCVVGLHGTGSPEPTSLESNPILSQSQLSNEVLQSADFCPICGNKLDLSKKFCMNCGKRIKD